MDQYWNYGGNSYNTENCFGTVYPQQQYMGSYQTNLQHFQQETHVQSSEPTPPGFLPPLPPETANPPPPPPSTYHYQLPSMEHSYFNSAQVYSPHPGYSTQNNMNQAALARQRAEAVEQRIKAQSQSNFQTVSTIQQQPVTYSPSRANTVSHPALAPNQNLLNQKQTPHPQRTWADVAKTSSLQVKPPEQAQSVPSSNTPTTPQKMNHPPALKILTQKIMNITDAPLRQAALTELKQLISEKVAEDVLYSTNWATVELTCLQNNPAFKQKNKKKRKKKWDAEKVDAQIGNMVSGYAAKTLNTQLDPAEQQPKKKKKKQAIQAMAVSSQEASQRKERAARFQTKKGKPRWLPAAQLPAAAEENELDYDAMVVKGTCTDIEKRYLRLTSAPNPSSVRTYATLEKALENVKRRWLQDSNYFYACEQLKSIRQDLTVQHIRNAFTVTVYATHARLALENQDLCEYNQCQNQLVVLFSEDLGSRAVHTEFLAYRLLYSIHVANFSDMLKLLTQCLDCGDNQFIKHALAVRNAIVSEDFVAFFQLYVDAPGMSGYLLDLFADRVRKKALLSMCHSYRPTVPVSYIAEILAHESEEDCVLFLEGECGCVLAPKDGCPKAVVDCGKSIVAVAAACKGSVELMHFA